MRLHRCVCHCGEQFSLTPKVPVQRRLLDAKPLCQTPRTDVVNANFIKQRKSLVDYGFAIPSRHGLLPYH